MLISLGVTTGQGYFMGRPAAAAAWREEHPAEAIDEKMAGNTRARSSTVEQGTFNPLVPGSNPGGLTEKMSARRAKVRHGPIPQTCDRCASRHGRERLLREEVR